MNMTEKSRKSRRPKVACVPKKIKKSRKSMAMSRREKKVIDLINIIETQAPATNVESPAKSTSEMNTTEKSRKSRRPMVAYVPKNNKKSRKWIEISGPSFTKAIPQAVINPLSNASLENTISTIPTNTVSPMSYFTPSPAMCFVTPPATRIPSAIEEIFKIANDHNGPVRTLDASSDDQKFHVKVMWGELPSQASGFGMSKRLARRKPQDSETDERSSTESNEGSSKSLKQDPFAKWEKFD